MNPENALMAVAELAQAESVSWRQFESTCAALAAPTMRSASLDGKVSSGDHSDPVGNQVESHAFYWETEALTAELLGLAREVQKRMTAVRNRTVDIGPDVAAARCDGSIDPLCTKNAVTKNPAALCWSCLKKRTERNKHANGAA